MGDWIEDRASIPLILSLPVVFHASRIAIQGTTAGSDPQLRTPEFCAGDEDCKAQIRFSFMIF